MTAVITALVGVVLLVALATAVAWQERRRIPERSIVYGVEESISFVSANLGPEARSALKGSDVRRILEWSVRYLQDPGVRAEGGPPVAGGLDAARYVQERCLAAGHAYDGELVVEVLRLQNEYLASLGAIGDTVDDAGGGTGGATVD